MENWHEMLWTRAIWFLQYHTFRYIWHYLEIEWFPFGACCGCRPDDSGSTRASFCKRRHFGYKCGGPDRYISGRNDTQTADFFTPEFTNRIHPNKKGGQKETLLVIWFTQDIAGRKTLVRGLFLHQHPRLVRRPFQWWFQSPSPGTWRNVIWETWREMLSFSIGSIGSHDSWRDGDVV